MKSTAFKTFHDHPSKSTCIGENVELEVGDALQKIGFGIWQVQLLLTLCIGSLADASEATLLSFLGPCAQDELHLSNAQTSFINSVVFCGSMGGAIFFGCFADLYGRKASYGFSLFILVVFGVLTSISRSYLELLLYRGFVGFGLGGSVASFDFVAETVPAEIRGLCCLIPSIFGGIGSVMTASAAWLVLGSYGWRSIALICTVPVFLALLAVFFLPESPRWLLSQGKGQEAVQALKRAAKANGIILGEFTLKPITTAQHEADSWIIFKHPLRRTTLLLIGNWASFGFCYYALSQFSTKMFEVPSSVSQCSFAYEDILIPALSEPFMITISMLFVEKSRRLSQSASYFSSCAFIICLGLPLSNLSLATSAFFAKGCLAVACSITWLVTPEFYPTKIRATAHALLYNFARVGASLSSLWVYSGLSSVVMTGLVAAICFVCGLFSLLLPESAGNELDHGLEDFSLASKENSARQKYKTFYCHPHSLPINHDESLTFVAFSC